MQRRWHFIVLLLLVPECGGQTVGTPQSDPPSAEDGGYAGDFPAIDASLGDDEVAVFPSPESASPPDQAQSLGDAPAGPPSVATPGDACPQLLAPADLLIDELMIESVAGAGDYGEWVEVESTLDCSVNLRGLHGECPRGAKVATFDVTGDFWLPPRATFLVVDSSDPAINHDLPGPLLVWLGQSGDALRNKGATVTLRIRDAVVDSVTYPALPLAVGVSLAFPSDCDPSLRSDFTRWQRSTASFFPGFFGTPNAPNVDVQCP